MRRALVIALVSVASCRRQHYAASSVPELGYPQCEGRIPEPGPVLAEGDLRAGPFSVEHSARETFTIRRNGCLVVADGRQEWPLQIADTQVVYDARTLLPLRAWRRLTIPGVQDSDGRADIRRYEFRTHPTTVKIHAHGESVRFEELRGPTPRVVIAPGRALITMWLQRARLSVGALERQPAIDLREPLERLEDATLRRDPDLYQPWLGRTVRVYTVYGRDTVFADERDVVIGDLAGLRPDALLPQPGPYRMPVYGEPDPVHTP
jgi:hypothetical protein